MFFSRFSNSLGLLGVDYSARGIRMLQVRETPGTNALELVGAARIELPKDPTRPGDSQPTAKEVAIEDAASNLAAMHALAERVRGALAHGHFAGRDCVVSLPRQVVHVQSIRVPKMPDAELKQTAAWEAAQRFGMSRESIEVDFIRTGATLANAENREEVIVIAASREAIQSRLEPLIEAGLRPVAVETSFAALVRTFSRQARRDADLATTRVVVEIGATGSTILILRGDQIAFCKPLSISGGMLDRAVGDHLQVPIEKARELRQRRIDAMSARLAEAGEATSDDPAIDRTVFTAVRPIMNELAKEITLCMRYYGVTFRGQMPKKLILAGGEALEPKLNEVVADACKMEVVFDDPPNVLASLMLAVRETLHSETGPASSWAASIGLSLRGLERRRVEKRTSQIQEAVRAA